MVHFSLGQRLVSNLTPTQLERKRTRDKLAQRQLREKWKSGTLKLQQEVKQLHEQFSRVVASHRTLEAEVLYLRGRVGTAQAQRQETTMYKSLPSSTCNTGCFLQSELGYGTSSWLYGGSGIGPIYPLTAGNAQSWGQQRDSFHGYCCEGDWSYGKIKLA